MLAEFRGGGNLLYCFVIGKGVDATFRKIIILPPKADISIRGSEAQRAKK
jgi:hypothetical protein